MFFFKFLKRGKQRKQRVAFLHSFLISFLCATQLQCKNRSKQFPAQSEENIQANYIKEILNKESASLKKVTDKIPTLVADGNCTKTKVSGKNCLIVRNAKTNFTINLHYQFYENQFVDSKETIVFLNGGPGGSYLNYLGMQSFKELAKKFNIMLYDQRGAGESSPLSKKENLLNFTIANHIADIEILRKNVIKAEKVIIMGHSFGAHLALAYASEFPNSVKKLIAMNGSADSLGFVTQSTTRRQMFERISTKVLGKELMEKFNRLAEQGKLQNPMGENIESLFTDLHPMLYTYEGQTVLLPNSLLEYRNRYFGKKRESAIADFQLTSQNGKSYLFRPSKTESEFFFPSPNLFLRKNQTQQPSASFNLNNSAESQKNPAELNVIANQWTVCFHLLTPPAIKQVTEAYQLTPAVRRSTRCSDFPKFIAPFDYKNSLQKISAPTLITGGTNDPLVPFSIQVRDYQLISKNNKKTAVMVVPNTGHDPEENLPCIENILSRFLNDELIQFGEQKCTVK